jgi:hypothetical protein
MALVAANVSFDHAGQQYKQGHMIDTAHYLYTLFPSRFSAVSLSAGNSASGSTTGTCVKKIEVFTTAGVSLGFIPVYDAIT